MVKDHVGRRARAFQRQGGKCHWCGCDMVLAKGPGNAKANDMPHDLCTLDHLDERGTPQRGKYPGKLRTVAACWLCNHTRGKEFEKRKSRAQRRAESQRGHITRASI